MESIYQKKLSFILMIELVATAWCCVLWIKNRRWQVATFIFMYAELKKNLARQFPSDFEAIESEDTLGEFIASSIRYIPHYHIVETGYLYLFQVGFIVVLISFILYKKVKHNYSFKQIWHAFTQYRPFLAKKIDG